MNNNYEIGDKVILTSDESRFPHGEGCEITDTGIEPNTYELFGKDRWGEDIADYVHEALFRPA